MGQPPLPHLLRAVKLLQASLQQLHGSHLQTSWIMGLSSSSSKAAATAPTAVLPQGAAGCRAARSGVTERPAGACSARLQPAFMQEGGWDGPTADGRPGNRPPSTPVVSPGPAHGPLPWMAQQFCRGLGLACQQQQSRSLHNKGK